MTAQAATDSQPDQRRRPAAPAVIEPFRALIDQHYRMLVEYSRERAWRTLDHGGWCADPPPATVPPAERSLQFGPRPGRRHERPLDLALDVAASAGWSHVELPGGSVAALDPQAAKVITRLVRRLFARKAMMCDERHQSRRLRHQDVAVVVSDDDQRDALRVALRRTGLARVDVRTADALGRDTFDLVIAWHPPIALDRDGSGLDPARVRRMLSRHLHACIVVARAGDRQRIETLAVPATHGPIAWPPNVYDRCFAHAVVFAALEPYRVAIV